MPKQVPALRNVYQIALQPQNIVTQYYQAVLNNIVPAIEAEFNNFFRNNMNTTVELNLMPAFGGFMLPEDNLSVVLTYDYINQNIQICYIPFMADVDNMNGEYESEVVEYKINDPEALEYEGIKHWQTKDFVSAIVKALYDHELITHDGDIPNKYKPLQINTEIGLS